MHGKNYIHTRSGRSFIGTVGQDLIGEQNSLVVATTGCTFHARRDSLFIAGDGSIGNAEGGSIGIAEPGAKVYVYDGSVLFARNPEHIQVHQNGTVIYDGNRTNIAANKDANLIHVSSLVLPLAVDGNQVKLNLDALNSCPNLHPQLRAKIISLFNALKSTRLENLPVQD